MPKSKDTSKPETVAEQEAGGACHPRLVRQAFNAALIEKFRETLLLDERRVTYDTMTPDQQMVVLHALKFPIESFKPNNL
jgi:hypothetical protein